MVPQSRGNVHWLIMQEGYTSHLSLNLSFWVDIVGVLSLIGVPDPLQDFRYQRKGITCCVSSTASEKGLMSVLLGAPLGKPALHLERCGCPARGLLRREEPTISASGDEAVLTLIAGDSVDTGSLTNFLIH